MATDFNLSYQATPTFQKVHRDPSSYIFVRGPVGSGKSSGCIWHLFLNAIHQEPNSRGVRTPHYAVIRSTYPELKSTTIKSWTQWFGPLLKMTYATPIKGRIEMPLADGTQLDMELTFIALDREEEVSKLQSLELTGAHVNEAADIPLSVIQMLKSRIGRWPSRRNGGCTHKFIICDYNSVNTEHELYDLAENVRPEGYSFYTQPSALLLVDKGKGFVKDLEGNEYIINPEAENLATEDNPDAGVTADYYIDQVKGAASDWINVYLMNNYGMARHGKPVFYQYKDNMHCAEDPIKPIRGVPIIIGIDTGLCYTPDHEVLTYSGWKSIQEVDIETDLIATRNSDTSELEYQFASSKIDKEYSGTVIEWETQSFSFKVTEDHMIPFSFRDTPNKIYKKSARELVDTCSGHHFLNATSSWSGFELSSEELPLGLDPIIYAKFMGWYLSEGNIDSTEKNTNKIQITQKDERFVPVIKELLDKLPVKFNRSNGCFSGSNKELADYLKKFGKSHDKFIPDEIKFATKEIMYHFLEAYTMGDGSMRQRKNGSIEHTIATKSKRMADDLQELAQKFGINAYIVKRPAAKSFFKKENRYINGSEYYSVSFRSTVSRYELLGNTKDNNNRIKESNYEGKVYCLTVPNGTLLIRRNGKVHWNGNCPAAAFTQLTPTGTLQVIDEIVTDDCSIIEFCEDLLWPKLRNLYSEFKYILYLDPACAQRSQNDKKSALDIFREHGLPVQPASTNADLARREAVIYFLRKQNGFLLSPECTGLRKGFISDYHYPKVKNTALTKFKDEPEKNWASHVHDALQYAALELKGSRVDYKRPTKRTSTAGSRRVGDSVGGY